LAVELAVTNGRASGAQSLGLETDGDRAARLD